MVKSLYRNNIKYIKDLNLSLFKKIENTSIENSYIVKSRDGNKNIVKNTDKGKIHIHSSYDIKAEAEYLSNFALKENPDIIFLFGIGLGYELKKMKKKNPDARYFVVEPDCEIFKLALQNKNMKFLFEDSNLYFIQDNQYENIINFFQQVIKDDKNINIKFVIIPSYESIYKELINKVYEYIKIVINIFKVNIATNLFNHRQWYQNGICNLKYLKETCPVSALKESFKGVPAIIVSAGPSLNENIEFIEKVKDKAVIAAVGTGIAIMEKNKIKVNIAGALDGSKLEEDLLKGIDINRDAALFYSSVLYYTIASKIGNSKFLMNTTYFDEYYDKILNWDEFDIYSGPSVANTIAYNLSNLGCNPIIFLGQDLCYSMDKNYADGIEDVKGKNEIDENTKKDCTITQNKLGEDVYTNDGFMAMKELMEDCISLFPDITYLNGTSKGLKIQGTLDIDFNEYAQKELITRNDNDFDEVIEKTYQNYLKNLDVDFINKTLKDIEQQNDKITDICKEILNYIIDNDVQKINKFVEKKKSELNEISFYKEVMVKYLDGIDYIFKKLNYKDKNLKIYSYILDKCLIMKNAFTYEVYGGSKNE